MDDWKPTTYDLQWQKEMLRIMKIGGMWVTTYGVYNKESENKIILIGINRDAPNWKEMISRTETVITMCGYEYEVNEILENGKDEGKFVFKN